MKQCPSCRLTENETEFYQGKNNYCRECWRAKVRAWKRTSAGKKSVERTKEYKRKQYAKSEQHLNAVAKREDIKRRKEDKKKQWEETQREWERKRNIESSECKKCGETKPSSEFWRHKNGMLRNECKACQLEKFAYFKKGKKSGNKSQKAITAWGLVKASIQRGELTPPESCPECGSTKRIQAHHHYYDKPLDVIWLCELCHMALHHSDTPTASCTTP